MILIAFGIWSSASGKYFIRDRIYYRHHWTPFVKIRRRYTMDKYSRRWVNWIFNPYGVYKSYAITLGQTTYFSCPSEDVSAAWHRHEDKHKEQWKKNGIIKFSILYLWYSLWNGYYLNPFEVEARKAEAEPKA